MSKFRYETFYGDDYKYFAVNAEMYTEAQASKLFVEEQDPEPGTVNSYSMGYVYHGFGNVDGETVNGFWLSDEPKGRHPIKCYVYGMTY